MSNLEFNFKPHDCEACMFAFAGLCWGELTLIEADSGVALQVLVIPIARGSTLYGARLTYYIFQLRTMFMGTTRGLPA